MTDEMRVALVAVAMAAGLAVTEAWEVVDGLDAGELDGDARAKAVAVATRALDIVHPADVSA